MKINFRVARENIHSYEGTSDKAKNFTALAGYYADIEIDVEKTEKKRHLPRAKCPSSRYFSGRNMHSYSN